MSIYYTGVEPPMQQASIPYWECSNYLYMRLNENALMTIPQHCQTPQAQVAGVSDTCKRTNWSNNELIIL